MKRANPRILTINGGSSNLAGTAYKISNMFSRHYGFCQAGKIPLDGT